MKIEKNSVTYSLPLSYVENEDTSSLEDNYKNKARSLSETSEYLFAEELGIDGNRFYLQFSLSQMKAFQFIRQIKFEDALYYFRSLINIAKNNTDVIWDKNNFFVDLTERKMKVLVFGFDGHPIYSTVNNLEGLRELILLSLTNLERVLGKPRRIEFIDQRDMVINFAEGIFKANSIDAIEKNVEEELYYYEQLKEEEEAFKANATKTTIFINKIKARLNRNSQGKSIDNVPVTSSTNKNLPTKYHKKPKRTDWFSNGYVLVGICIIAVVFLAAYINLSSNTSSAEQDVEKKEKPKNDEITKKQSNQKQFSQNISQCYKWA